MTAVDDSMTGTVDEVDEVAAAAPSTQLFSKVFPAPASSDLLFAIFSVGRTTMIRGKRISSSQSEGVDNNKLTVRCWSI